MNGLFKTKKRLKGRFFVHKRCAQIWSGWQDSNLRPPAPQAGTLPGCATPRNFVITKAEYYTLQIASMASNSCRISINSETGSVAELPALLLCFRRLRAPSMVKPCS